jgi:hypothetical protein
MRLGERLKLAFAPKSHSTTNSHYIPAVQYADSGVENSIWQSEVARPPQDWKGNNGRIYDRQVLTSQGPLLTALKVVPEAGIGGTGIAYGQNVTIPVAGFAGRAAVLDPTSLASEYNMVNA